MTLNDFYFYVKMHGEYWLQRDGKGTGYVCPICGSGSGDKGTGISSKKGNKGWPIFTCWSGDCFKKGSTYVDILIAENGVNPNDTKEINKMMVQFASEKGITLDKQVFAEKQKIQSKSVLQPKKQERNNEETIDYSSFYEECHNHIEETDYWKKRGLSKDTIEHFNIGFCKDWRLPSVPKTVPGKPYLIIPISKNNYLARRTDGIDSYAKMKVGHSDIFNFDVIQTTEKPIFVVEGEIDAMSISEASYNAIGLGSVVMIDKFLDKLDKLSFTSKKENYYHSFIIALDNDDAGRKAQEKIKLKMKYFTEKGILFSFVDTKTLYHGYKDANEALIEIAYKHENDIFSYGPPFRDAIEKAEKEIKEKQQKDYDEIKKDNIYNYLPTFESNISNIKFRIPTNFKKLDKILGDNCSSGGLFSGLYIIGAVPSLGKTTFCLQIMDQIAQQGKDVIIFSLEMSKDELISKSISRITCEMLTETELTDGDYYDYQKSLAKTTRGILSYGERVKKYSEDEKNHIQKALEKYSQYANHIYIYSADSDGVSTDMIREKVAHYKSVTGKAPIVLVDYLQIINVQDKYLTDKQAIDKNVKDMKIISRDFDTTIMVISSFNREGYYSNSMASFKESGAIEYSADVLLGLYYTELKGITKAEEIQSCLNDIMEKAKKGESIDVTCRVLKNRNGTKGEAEFDFLPFYNRFIEKGYENDE